MCGSSRLAPGTTSPSTQSSKTSCPRSTIGQFFLKLLMALFGLFGLVSAGGADKVTVLNAFLLGYSLDSVVELFAASIEQRAAAQVASLSRQLNVTTG